MRTLLTSLVVTLAAAVMFADDPAAPAKTKGGKTISVKGQSPDAREGKLTDQPPRYYVWTDPQGWHLRSAAKEGGIIKFEGSIALSEGEFGKLRPIGLESKGKFADRWEVDAARQKLNFLIYTSGSFDGFDFTISKAKDPQVSFDLKIGGKPMPGRIFVGKEAEHPAEAVFSLSEGP